MRKGYETDDSKDKPEGVPNGEPLNTPFDIPADYFLEAPGTMLELVKNIDQDNIGWDAVRDMPYEVPEGYFHSFPHLISNIVAGGFVGEQSTMQVPLGYFKSLPQQMLATAKAADQKQSKSISFFTMLRARSLSVAAAAILVLAVGFGIIATLWHGQHIENNKMLPGVTRSEISDFVQQYYTDAEADVALNSKQLALMKFENNDIIQYLNETGWDGTE